MFHKLLNSIALILEDYRADEVGGICVERIDRWVRQFDDSVQYNILEEIDYVFKKTYISKEKVNYVIRKISLSEKIAGNKPELFWKSAKLLDIQKGGNSQAEMNDLLSAVIHEKYGFSIYENQDPRYYIYLDDAIFTGNRVLIDLDSWLTSVSIQESAEVYIIVIASHRSGLYYAKKNLNKKLRQANKSHIQIKFYYYFEIEDRKAYINASDVLRPVSIPDDRLTTLYVQDMKYKLDLRKPGYAGNNNYFSSERGRHLLEQEFLKAGVRIRSMCPHLNKYQRPLGNMVLDTLGFGSMLVTYRNCPNNNPLALWAGDPWYPLLPRKVN